jgi:hypothetical protein
MDSNIESYLEIIKRHILNIKEYDKLIELLIRDIIIYNKSNGTFFKSIMAKKRNGYYKFYKINYIPLSEGRNYYFTELNESNAGNYLKSNIMRNNPKLYSMSRLLIETIRDRNEIVKSISQLSTNLNRRKVKIDKIRDFYQKALDI